MEVTTQSSSIIQQMNDKSAPGNVWDRGEPNSVKGLHLRVLPSGRRAFYFIYTTKSGRRRRPKIGDVPGTKLSEARERARILTTRIAIGEDPKGDWAAKKAEMTIHDAFNDTAYEYWSKKRFIDSGRLREVTSIFTRSIELDFGRLKLSDLTQVDVRRWHADFDSAVSANRALEVLSRVYTYQIENGWTGKNPCVGVKANVERKRRRFATEAELKLIGEKLYERIERGGYHRSGAVFLLALMFTGARPKSLEQALWSQISFLGDGTIGETQGSAVLVFSGKGTADSGDQESVVLPRQILSLLRRGDPGSRVFNGFQSWRSVWNQIRGEVGCTDLWARDLRRTFATVGLSSGLSIGAIGETLNHKSTQTTKVYAKVFDQVKVETTEKIVSRMEEMIGQKS